MINALPEKKLKLVLRKGLQRLAEMVDHIDTNLCSNIISVSLLLAEAVFLQICHCSNGLKFYSISIDDIRGKRKFR